MSIFADNIFYNILLNHLQNIDQFLQQFMMNVTLKYHDVAVKIKVKRTAFHHI
uniref:Uncharacterized protein n=1 Tax=Anguilla anguilla TaxID=7936 RepID=A0A0E9RF00_ANGAN